MIACLPFLWSCGNSTPKCDDKEVTKTVISILEENPYSLSYENGRSSGVAIDRKKAKVKNIMTTKTDDGLNICGCEGTVESPIGINSSTIEGSVSYSAQKNSEDKVVVKVDNVGPFKIKLNF